MKKAHTMYSADIRDGIAMLTVNEEVDDNVSLHEWGEPCSGILKHWGTHRELINELGQYILLLKQSEEKQLNERATLNP